MAGEAEKGRGEALGGDDAEEAYEGCQLSRFMAVLKLVLVARNLFSVHNFGLPNF